MQCAQLRIKIKALVRLKQNSVKGYGEVRSATVDIASQVHIIYECQSIMIGLDCLCLMGRRIVGLKKGQFSGSKYLLVALLSDFTQYTDNTLGVWSYCIVVLYSCHFSLIE